MGRYAVEYCQKCIMPLSSPIVFLNKAGECNFCSNHQEIGFLGEEELLRVIESYRSIGEYDCIVNISGGRDSTFTLLKMAKDYSLKVLAVNYENPFTHPQAKKNIANAVRRLDVKLIQFSFKNDRYEKVLRNNILTWFKNPATAMVPVICIGCKIIWPRILKIAKERGVKLIVNGGNPYEYTSFKKELLGVRNSSALEKTYLWNIVGLINESIRNLGYLNLRYLPITLKAFLFSNQYAIGSRVFGHGIRRIDLFHYLEWDEKMVLSRIQDELDWNSPKEHHGTWRFDCQISHLKDFLYLKTIAMTEKSDFYSKLVRSGKISRNEALQRIEMENQIQINAIEQLFAKLQIGSIDLKKEMADLSN